MDAQNSFGVPIRDNWETIEIQDRVKYGDTVIWGTEERITTFFAREDLSSSSTDDTTPKEEIDESSYASRLDRFFPSFDDYRTWNGSTYKFQIEALFSSNANGKVKLTKRDGEVIELPFERLCEEDQEFIKSRR